jgi:hypothetical protein
MFARALCLALTLFLVSIVAACGSGDDDDAGNEEDTSLLDEIVESIDQIDEEFLEEEAQVPEDHEVNTESEEEAPSSDEVEVVEGTGEIEVFAREDIPPEVYAEYDALVEFVIEDLDFYWGQILPEIFGVELVLPEILGGYDDVDDVDCGGVPAELNNAFYCPIGHFITWDEPGLLLPYYLNVGDFGAAFILAHEYGHAIQAQLGIEADFAIDFELQADCFAGAWALSADEAGILEEGDIDEGIATLYMIADPEGLPWTDPQAHGTAEERIDAFALGFNEGVESCVA